MQLSPDLRKRKIPISTSPQIPFFCKPQLADAKLFTLLILLITTVLSPSSAGTSEAKHEYYIGVAEMECVENQIKASALFFADDLGLALGISSADWESPKADSALAKYFRQHLRFEQSTAPTFDWVGHEIQGEQIRCFLSAKSSNLRAFAAPLRFDILMDRYPAQKNLLHLRFGQRTKSWYFSERQRVQKLEIP